MALIAVRPGLENRPKSLGKIFVGPRSYQIFSLRKCKTFRAQPWLRMTCVTHVRGFGIEPDMGV